MLRPRAVKPAERESYRGKKRVPGIRTKTAAAFRGFLRQKHVRVVLLSTAHKSSMILISVGLLLLFFPLIQRSFFEEPNSKQNVESLKPGLQTDPRTSAFGPIRIAEDLTRGTVIAQPPARILVPSVKIDVAVNESRVVNGFWEVSEVTASHGMGSSFPGLPGNTVLFAHAREGLFLPLRDLKIGNIIYVLTNDRWHRYRVESSREVRPSDIQVIQPTKDETLTLFTCSGFLDSKRLVVVAIPDR